jgi:peptidoglycan/xylan/chitin deacetylase (PgdA/CDA1 family)
MTLPETYLKYPYRRHGMDHDLYPWRLSVDRPKVVLPGGREIACLIVVPLEFQRLNPEGKPFKHPGAMQTPYPDLRHYTTRDYGLRVGAFRILRALKAAGLKAVFPVNATLLTRVRPLLDAIVADGHEIAAYGWDADCIHFGGMDSELEERRIMEVRAAFRDAGFAPRTWMSPARSQSRHTLDLIKRSGFDICLDWEIDHVPVAFRTEAGPVNCVPLFNELDDRKLLIDNRQTESEWRDQILEAAGLLKEEYARFGAQILSFTLTPYVIGQPFRIWALRETLSVLRNDRAVWSATALDVVEAWRT